MDKCNARKVEPERNSSPAAAKLLQSCPTLCNPIDGSPLGSSVPGILQTRTLEWVAISFSNAWKWKVKVKSLSRAQLLAIPWTIVYQASPSMGFSRQEYWVGCHCNPRAIKIHNFANFIKTCCLSLFRLLKQNAIYWVSWKQQIFLSQSSGVWKVQDQDASRLMSGEGHFLVHESRLLSSHLLAVFHSNPKERQCQRMLKLPHNCTHLTHY